MRPTIEIRRGFHKRLLGGFPWLYANEIQDINTLKSIPAGEVVSLNYEGKSLGYGYFNRHSLIAFRLLSRDSAEALDVDFFVRRFRKAEKARAIFYPKPYCRLIHAEADHLPGLIIDRYGETFVIQIGTQGMEKLIALITSALEKAFTAKTMVINRSSTVRTLEGLEILPDEHLGAPADFLRVDENDITFAIAQNTSQKTGWFYDHRENRLLVRKIAKGRRVLDYYSYCGGFALNAAAGGALSVTGIDRSEASLNNARYSAAQNGLDKICQFFAKDAFKDLDERIAAQEKYDLIILDPPAFVKAKKDKNAGLKGYEKMVTKGLHLLAEEGLILIASCSYHVMNSDLLECINAALKKTGREAKVLKTLEAGFDHPSHPQLAESTYLKGFLLAAR